MRVRSSRRLNPEGMDRTKTVNETKRNLDQYYFWFTWKVILKSVGQWKSLLRLMRLNLFTDLLQLLQLRTVFESQSAHFIIHFLEFIFDAVLPSEHADLLLWLVGAISIALCHKVLLRNWFFYPPVSLRLNHLLQRNFVWLWVELGTVYQSIIAIMAVSKAKQIAGCFVLFWRFGHWNYWVWVWSTLINQQYKYKFKIGLGWNYPWKLSFSLK